MKDVTEVLNVLSKNTLSTLASLRKSFVRTVENHYAFLANFMHY